MANEGGGEAGVAGYLEPPVSDADADALIAEAVRRREEQWSGKSMSGRLPLVGGCVVAGLLLIACGRFLAEPMADLAIVAGAIILAIAGLLLLRALDLSPATQWGEPIGEPCPACGERGLREERVAAGEANGIVALCTPECGYAEVGPDPGGPPGHGGSPNLWSGLSRLLRRRQ